MQAQVLKIANEVRDLMEKIADQEYWPDDLCGLCARAAAELNRRLTEAGIESSIAVVSDGCWEWHVFNIVDNMVVDVTATQFDYKRRVMVARLYSRDHWVPTHRFKTANGLRAHQKRQGWSRQQVARLKEAA